MAQVVISETTASFRTELKSALRAHRIQKSAMTSGNKHRFQNSPEVRTTLQKSDLGPTDTRRFHISGLSGFKLLLKLVMSAFGSCHCVGGSLCEYINLPGYSSVRVVRSKHLQKVHSRTAARWGHALSSGLLEPWRRFSMRALPIWVPAVRASRSGESDSSSPDHRRAPVR